MSEHGTPHTGARSPGVTRPGWLPFSLVVATLAVLAGLALTLTALAPERAAGAVGVYERVSLVDIENPEAPAIAGFIAPEGWLRQEPDEDGDGSAAKRADFSTATGDARLSATVHTGVPSADALLLENAPVGAALTPIAGLPLSSGLESRMLAYDLEAGGGFVQSIAVCSTGASRACLLFDVTVLDPGAALDEPRPDISAVLDSAEVYS